MKNEDDRCTANRREPTDNDGAARLSVEPDNVPPVVEEASPSGSKTRVVGQAFLDGRLAFWQKRLNLSDWRISVAFTPRSDLKPHTLGGIRWDKAKKNADMWVLDPSDYRLPFPEMLDDMEFTIVHELVHLELVSLPHSEASRSPEEQAVNRIADALLALDRQK